MTSFVRKIQHFQIVSLRDTMMQRYLVEKIVYPQKSQRFEPFIHMYFIS